MSEETKPDLILSQPVDRSLAAFKRWMQELMDKMGAQDSGLTEEEWKTAWQQFWKESEE